MIQVGDQVVQLINQFTPEQVEDLKEQVIISKHLAKGRKSTRNREFLKTSPDRGKVIGLEDRDDGRYYLIQVNLGGRKRMRWVHEKKIALESEYDPSQEVDVPV